jgi:hypothetical protein
LLVDDPESCRIYDLRTDRAPELATPPPQEELATPALASRAEKRPAGRRGPAREERPVVIYGAARSGTTYLVKILNRHPKIYISDESRIFLWAHEMAERLRWHERALGGDEDEPGGRRIGDRRRLGDHLARALPELVRDFYRELEPVNKAGTAFQLSLSDTYNGGYVASHSINALGIEIDTEPGLRRPNSGERV